jgi:hypothetical protein
MSALLPKADIRSAKTNVRFGSKADICQSRLNANGGLFGKLSFVIDFINLSTIWSMLKLAWRDDLNASFTELHT